MPANLPKTSASDWDPGSAGGKSKSDAVEDKLNRPNAVERPDAVNGTNELKPFVGKGGTPKGPFGQRGKEF